MTISYQDEYERQKAKAEALDGAMKIGIRRDNEKNREIVILKARVKELEEKLDDYCGGGNCKQQGGILGGVRIGGLGNEQTSDG